MATQAGSLPDMPALRQEEMVSTERDLGPSVPTILVIAGKKLCVFSADQSNLGFINQSDKKTSNKTEAK
jgi:hypothetical protein